MSSTRWCCYTVVAQADALKERLNTYLYRACLLTDRRGPTTIMKTDLQVGLLIPQSGDRIDPQRAQHRRDGGDHTRAEQTADGERVDACIGGRQAEQESLEQP